eukprot:CAMPEP_0170512738 /NCGR_PEP_ID=MMETSP0208-20121228/67017_1 /TAXON_ID=197538 /ORGANISM="Strombidium inclinatum, Strain S3" /LENGTH=41 /DNA_ID= /DNA_START= /DNA_END= /DNA_ORIENTATION=
MASAFVKVACVDLLVAFLPLESNYQDSPEPLDGLESEKQAK